MEITNPVSDYIARSILTADNMLPLRVDGAPAGFPTDHFVSAYSSAGQVIPTAMPTQIQLNTEILDLQGDFDHTTYLLKPTKEGLWLIAGMVGFQNLGNGNNMAAMIRVNAGQGKTTYATSSSGTDRDCCLTFDIMHLETSDEIGLNGWQNSGANKNTLSGTVYSTFIAWLLPVDYTP